MQLMTVLCHQPAIGLGGAMQNLPLASVHVYAPGTTTPAALYDIANASLANPVTADINGLASFKAADGSYDIRVVSADGTYTAPLLPSVQLFDSTSYIDTDTGVAVGAITLPGDPTSANQAATKHYVDNAFAAVDAMVFKGALNCSTNPNYPAAGAGET